MIRWEAWALHGSNLLVGGTGLVYAAMRYFMEPSDPFAVVNHPAQPHWQHAHILTAPALAIVIGMILKDHAFPKLEWGRSAGRRSGLLLLITALPMIFSGYLLQTAVEPSWRTTWIAVHLTTSGLWFIAWIAHWLRAKYFAGIKA